MVSSVAVADAGKLLAELTVQTRLTHSETLLPHVQQVLEMANTKKQDLEAVAVSMGPGSFTGYCQGYCLRTEHPYYRGAYHGGAGLALSSARGGSSAIY